jgi:very-short-patch-repair endonuclease
MKYQCGHQFPGVEDLPSHCPAIVGPGRRCGSPAVGSKGKQKKIKVKKARPDLEGMILHQLQRYGIRCEEKNRQHRFSKRRWKFDFAWPEYMLAVEIHGGTYVPLHRRGMQQPGAHSRGAHQRKDFEKWSHAAIDGWKILHFDTKDVQGKDRRAINTIITAMRKLCPSLVSHIG